LAPVELKFAVAFGAGAVLAGAGASAYPLFAWPAVTCTIVAASYAGLGAWPFGKNARGGIHPVATVLLAPYFAVAWVVLFVLRLRTEAGHHEIRPGLFLGRRELRARELPTNTTLVVDLTAELSRLAPKGAEYICLPTLDGSAPYDLPRARSIIERIVAHDGIVYVHCAAGHGRSAAIVACVLLAEGRATDAGDAVARIRGIRPGVGLSRSQRAFVEKMAPLR
jgi:protein-tyrosine phosphatase